MGGGGGGGWAAGGGGGGRLTSPVYSSIRLMDVLVEASVSTFE